VSSKLQLDVDVCHPMNANEGVVLFAGKTVLCYPYLSA